MVDLIDDLKMHRGRCKNSIFTGNSPRDWAFGAFLATALCGLWLLLPGGMELLNRLPWLDEVHSIRISEDPSLSHLVQAVMRNIDSTPPTYHIFSHILFRYLGVPPIPGLRWLSLLLTGSSMILLYLMLRRCVDRSSAVIGVLSFWSHPLAARYGFEARFYAPWLATAIGMIWFAMIRQCHRNPWNAAGLALASALLCSIHYLGILSWGLILCGLQLTPVVSLRERSRMLFPALAGPLALVASLPILFRQTGAYSVTWMELPDMGSSLSYLVHQLGGAQLALIGLALVSTVICRFRKPAGRCGMRSEAAWRDCSPALALLAMPLVVVIFSYWVQPMLVNRYSIPTLIGLGTLCACLASRVAMKLRPILMVGLLIQGLMSFHQVCAEVLVEAQEHRDRAAIIMNESPDLPVIFSRRLHQMPAIYAIPEIEPRAYYLSLNNDEMPVCSNLQVFDREAAWIYFTHYGLPPIVSRQEALKFPVFLFVARDFQGVDIPILFPGFKVQPLGDRVFKLTAREMAGP